MNFHFIFIFFLLISCKSNNMQKDTPKELLQHWVVSHEESDRPHILLRTPEYDFPLSRRRDEFIFKKDNQLVYNTLGPADRPVSKEGRWEWVDDSTLKLVVDELNTFYWKVEKIDDKVFKVEQLQK